MSITLFDKRGLLIDDIAEMRTTVRIQLADAGVERCDSVRNIKEAIDKLAENRYDLVVCDYNLGQGTDGQQFLELVRRRRVLPLTAAFLMVTGETGYEQVSTAAEYAPDDYLIKPFTSATLRTRLERILMKKEALKPLYQQLGDKGDRLKALALCDELLTKEPRYALDLLRHKGELLMQLRRHDEALSLYEGVLRQRATPWAEVGKARALAARGDAAAAKDHLQRALESYPNYLAAYDSLAELLRKSDARAAQEVVEQALKVAPSTQRQRELATLALDNRDFERAENAFRRVVERDRSGFFKSHDDYAGLAKSCVEQGRADEALAVVRDMSKNFTNSAELAARQAAVESQVHARAGNPGAARDALKRALDGMQAGGFNPATSLEIAQACFASGHADDAKRIIQAVAEDHHENDQVLAQAQSVFAKAGLGEEGEIFLEATKKRMIKLNNEAVALAKSGELDQAIAMLAEAADRLVNNAQVSLNTAVALLMKIQKTGRDDALAARAHGYIAQAQRANPGHPKLDETVAIYRKVASWPEAPALEF